MNCKTSSITDAVVSSSSILIKCPLLSLMSLVRSERKNRLAAARTALWVVSSLSFTTTFTSQKLWFLLRIFQRLTSSWRYSEGSADSIGWEKASILEFCQILWGTRASTSIDNQSHKSYYHATKTHAKSYWSWKHNIKLYMENKSWTIRSEFACKSGVEIEIDHVWLIHWIKTLEHSGMPFFVILGKFEQILVIAWIFYCYNNRLSYYK